MSSAVRPTTPTPPRTIRTPPAPRLGFHDSWEPYAPRKSARISSQRNTNRTPSPCTSPRQSSSSPRNKRHNDHSDAAMVSPTPTPHKKAQPKPASNRHFSGALTAESAANAASALGLPEQNSAAMLPTPAKTPKKAPNEKACAQIKTFARTLFSEEEAMPSPKKRRAKKYSGNTLESFTAEDVEDPIEIFVDSQDRIPERDESEANPFIDRPASPTLQRRSKRRLVAVPGEGAMSVEDASTRDDGMVYVFRGKRFFRKFADEEDPSRFQVKPRVLFGQDKSKALEDEEAATDVEDIEEEETAPLPQTPVKAKGEIQKTPDAPRFGQLSPPDTRRVTRSANKLLGDATPIKSSGRRSPFDNWRRTKDNKDGLGSKRQGESLASEHAKRART